MNACSPEDEMSKYIISEYVSASKLLISTQQSGNHVFGYSACLILLSALDAISQGTMESKDSCSFSILKKSEYGGITDNQERHLKNLFRHGLSHTATISPNCIIISDATDDTDAPFSFEDDDENTLSKINLYFLQKITEKIWNDVKQNFSPAKLTGKSAKKDIERMKDRDFGESSFYKKLLRFGTKLSGNPCGNNWVYKAEDQPMTAPSGLVLMDIDIDTLPLRIDRWWESFKIYNPQKKG